MPAPVGAEQGLIPSLGPTGSEQESKFPVAVRLAGVGAVRWETVGRGP